MKTKISLTAAAVFFCAAGAFAARPPKDAKQAKIYEVKTVLVAPYSGAITPAAAEFISEAVDKANGAGGADLVVLALDTPGGLDSSMRVIIQKMLASKKPVAVYVSPQGARAASAGVFISMASPLVAMAPGTNIGAAHPVSAGGQDIPDTMQEKVVNDMVAFIQSIAKERGRNRVEQGAR